MTDLDRQQENPYAPPSAAVEVVPASLFCHPGAELHSRRVLRAERFQNPLVRFLRTNPVRELHFRRIQFWGEFVGVVEWKASLHESVSVNDVVYCSIRNLGMDLIPRF
jgi:hypothetical protein